MVDTLTLSSCGDEMVVTMMVVSARSRVRYATHACEVQKRRSVRVCVQCIVCAEADHKACLQLLAQMHPSTLHIQSKGRFSIAHTRTHTRLRNMCDACAPIYVDVWVLMMAPVHAQNVSIHAYSTPLLSVLACPPPPWRWRRDRRTCVGGARYGVVVTRVGIQWGRCCRQMLSELGREAG